MTGIAGLLADASSSSIALVAVVAIAFTVEGALGFGATVVALALGALFTPVTTLLPAFVPLNMILSTSILVRDRKHVDRRVLLRAVIAMALGMPIGFLAARAVDVTVATKAFGVLVVALAVLELVRAFRAATTTVPNQARSLAALALAGVVHGAFGTGGPLAVYALGGALPDKGAFRATLAGLWLSLNIFLVGAFVVDGRAGVGSAETSLWLAPGLVAGILVGNLLHHRIPAALFRKIVWFALGVVGVFLVAR